MTHMRNLVFASAMLAAGFVAAQPPKAHATTMVATVCSIGFNPCPLGDVLDSGIRTNFVGTLGANRYAILPFKFVDAFTSVTGKVVAVDIASKYIYLVGFGAATSTIGPVDIDIAISQNYRTTPGNWTFGGFNIGACNAAATLDGDGVTSLPLVNNVGLGAPVSSGCSPFAQFFGPKTQAVGAVTNLKATAIFGFNGGGTQVITLPWGDDFPDPLFPNLDITPSTTFDSFQSALQADGLSLVVPEPDTWTLMLMGVGILGAGLRIKRRKTATATAAA